MENREKNSNPFDNTESPVEVIKKIVLTTVLTAVAGYLIYLTGII